MRRQALMRMDVSRDGLNSNSLSHQLKMEDRLKRKEEQRKALAPPVGLGGLKGPMVQRVYTAKPGCSACGK